MPIKHPSTTEVETDTCVRANVQSVHTPSRIFSFGADERKIDMALALGAVRTVLWLPLKSGLGYHKGFSWREQLNST